MVPLPVWKNLYEAALRFRTLRPWTILDDTQLVGVQDPLSGEIGYGCCMGNGGTLFGLCFYRGAAGFDSFLRLVSGEISPESMDNLFIQDCLKFELGSKSELDDEAMAVIQKLGLAFKGKQAWPQFQSLLPGYYPWYLDETEARFLTEGLNGVCHHFQQIQSGTTTESVRDGEVLVYTPTTDGYASRWGKWPIHRPPPPPPLEMDYVRVRSLLARGTKPDSPWEAGTFYSPSPVSEGDRPYFPKIALVAQASSGFIFNSHLFGPRENDVQSLFEVILGAIEKHGFLPSEILFSDGRIMTALTPLSVALGVRFAQVKTLPALEEAKEGFIQAFNPKQPRS